MGLSFVLLVKLGRHGVYEVGLMWVSYAGCIVGDIDMLFMK